MDLSSMFGARYGTASMQNPIDLTDAAEDHAKTPILISISRDEMELDDENKHQSDYAYACLLQEEEDMKYAFKASVMPNDHMAVDDEAYARNLQAEWNDSGYSTKPIQNTSLSEDITELQQFAAKVMSWRCPRCSRYMLKDPEALVKHTRALVSHSQSRPISSGSMGLLKGHSTAVRLHPYVLCGGCNVHMCMGCGSLGSLSGAEVPAGFSTPDFEMVQCCKNGRLFLVWALLCGPEHTQLPGGPRPSIFGSMTSSRAGSSSSRAGKAPALSTLTIVGSGATAVAAGTGYGGSQEASNPYLSKARQQCRKFQIEIAPKIRTISTEEKLFRSVFNALALLLPSIEREQDLDMVPPRILLAMLKRSPLVDKAAQLLRNWSTEESAPITELYDAIVEFVRVVGQHPITSPAVFCQRLDLPLAKTLIHASLPSPRAKSAVQDNTQLETLQSISEIVKSIGKEARRMLQHSTLTEMEFNTSDGQKTLELCTKFCELADFYSVNNFTGNDAFMSGTSMSDAQLEAEMQLWHRDNAVAETLDEALLPTYKFAAEAGNLTSAMTAPGRMKKLVSEISSFHSSLPMGVYVRHGASRLDTMKVLIVGPKDTPYENGLFEFDLLCPANYPNEPPKMHFKTTGAATAEGGQIGVRFNPNLYEDGKVCLSLLGTWQGEPWRAGKSTILQVLVSIQGMIFCDEPWYNEPGRENSRNDSASQAYNVTIRGQTMRHAMLDWLTGQAAGSSSVWADVVEKHFRINRRGVLATVNRWAAENASLGRHKDAVVKALGAYSGNSYAN